MFIFQVQQFCAIGLLIIIYHHQRQSMLKSPANLLKLTSFPKRIDDLNEMGHTLMPLNQKIEWPAINDTQYRKRRLAIGQLSKQHIMGQKIHQIQYTAEQHSLWRRVFQNLEKDHQETMIQPYLQNMAFLKKELGFNRHIPKMNDLSDYIKSKTGFQIKPVPGIISSRQFLNCLAFKVFCSAQFVRHPLSENFSHEPDLVHEYIGHIPMFADKYIGAMSQQLGLLSLGASDAVLQKLANAYFRTLEFGLCREKGKTKIYGAAISACLDDLIKMKRGEYQQRLLQKDLDQNLNADYAQPQNQYWISDSLPQALQSLIKFGKSLKTDFVCSYDEQSQEIRVDQIL